MQQLGTATQHLKPERRHLTADLINQTHSYRD